jgi:hypothetical protein
LFDAFEEHYISCRKVQKSLILELRQLPETCRKSRITMSLQEVYEKIIQLVQLITTNKPSEHDQILTLLQCVQDDDVRLDAIKDHHKFATLDEAFHAILSNTAARAHLSELKPHF